MHYRIAYRIAGLATLLAAIILVSALYSHSQVGGRIAKTVWGLNVLHYSKFLAEIPPASQLRMEAGMAAEIDALRTSAPRLTPGSGFYKEPIRVTAITQPTTALVRYTTDGSIPTNRAQILDGGLVISSTTTLRIKAFDEKDLPSETVSSTYIFETMGSMPVVNIVTDPAFLFDKHAGIVTNAFQRG
jgi:hypothetical protein